MATRKTLVQSKAGVRRERIEQLSAQGRVVQARFRLSTLRRNLRRLLVDDKEALDAFDVEVIASLSGPVVSRRLP